MLFCLPPELRALQLMTGRSRVETVVSAFGVNLVDHSFGRLPFKRAQSLQDLLPVFLCDSTTFDLGPLCGGGDDLQGSLPSEFACCTGSFFRVLCVLGFVSMVWRRRYISSVTSSSEYVLWAIWVLNLVWSPVPA